MYEFVFLAVEPFHSFFFSAFATTYYRCGYGIEIY